MARVRVVEMEDQKTIEAFNKVKALIIEKIKEQSFLIGDEAQILTDKTNQVVLMLSKSRSNLALGEMYVEECILALTKGGIRLKEGPMMDIIGHEFMHLLANTYYKRCVGHTHAFKKFCKAFGYGHVSATRVILGNDAFRNDLMPIWMEEALGIKVGAPKAKKPFKYEVSCTQCGRAKKYKQRTTVVKNPHQHKCRFCGGVLDSREL